MSRWQAAVAELLMDIQREHKHDTAVHQPRPERRPLPRRSYRRHVSRTDRGARHHRRQVFSPPYHPLYRGAPLGGADRRSRTVKKRAHRAWKACCRACMDPPDGLSVPARAVRASWAKICDDRAVRRVRDGRRGPRHRLPHPARGARAGRAGHRGAVAGRAVARRPIDTGRSRCPVRCRAAGTGPGDTREGAVPMSCEGKCELVEFKVASSRFIHIEPRPRSDAPSDLEQRLEDEVKAAVETSHHTCGDGCDCVTGEPVEVRSRQQIKKVAYGGYAGWYQLTIGSTAPPGSACRRRNRRRNARAASDRAEAGYRTFDPRIECRQATPARNARDLRRDGPACRFAPARTLFPATAGHPACARIPSRISGGLRENRDVSDRQAGQRIDEISGRSRQPPPRGRVQRHAARDDPQTPADQARRNPRSDPSHHVHRGDDHRLAARTDSGPVPHRGRLSGGRVLQVPRGDPGRGGAAERARPGDAPGRGVAHRGARQPCRRIWAAAARAAEAASSSTAERLRGRPSRSPAKALRFKAGIAARY